jgi:hypothetical protein
MIRLRQPQRNDGEGDAREHAIKFHSIAQAWKKGLIAIWCLGWMKGGSVEEKEKKIVSKRKKVRAWAARGADRVER